MSNAPITPPPESPSPAEPAAQPIDYGELPHTGVRRVLDAYEERDLQRVRWGAVIAGLFLAIGTQLLLGMLGVAIGLTAINPSSPNPLAGVAMGAGIWFAISWLIGLFIGGFAAARLSGTIRRGDGALNGLLTWATSLVLALWLAGTTAAGAMGTAADVLSQSPRGREAAAGQVERPSDLGRAARESVGDLERGAWATFGGTVLALIAAVIGGALGAVGRPKRARGGRGERFQRERGEVEQTARETRAAAEQRVDRNRDVGSRSA